VRSCRARRQVLRFDSGRVSALWVSISQTRLCGADAPFCQGVRPCMRKPLFPITGHFLSLIGAQASRVPGFRKGACCLATPSSAKAKRAADAAPHKQTELSPRSAHQAHELDGLPVAAVLPKRPSAPRWTASLVEFGPHGAKALAEFAHRNHAQKQEVFRNVLGPRNNLCVWRRAEEVRK
jgi:hypothetical protein